MVTDLCAFLDELRSQGCLDSHGAFSIDQARAFQKLQRYQMVEPHFYVLPLVASAVSAEASAIDITGDLHNCAFEHDGRTFHFDELATLFSSLLIGQSDLSRVPIRELATGLNAALALRPKRLSVVSWDGRDGARLQVDGRYLTVEQLDRSPWEAGERMELFSAGAVGKKTVIEIRGRSRDILERALASLGSGTPEWETIRSRCAYAALPIRINGEEVNRPLHLGAPLAVTRLIASTPGGLRLDWDPSPLDQSLPSPGPFKAWLGVLPEQLVSSCTFVIHGISFPMDLPEMTPGIRAVVVAPGLQKDLSHIGIVHNEDYYKILETLDRQAEDMYELLAHRWDHVPSWCRSDLTQSLDQVALRHLQRGQRERAQGLYQRIREIRELCVDPRNASRRFQLWANLYESQGNREEAAHYRSRALAPPSPSWESSGSSGHERLWSALEAGPVQGANTQARAAATPSEPPPTRELNWKVVLLRCLQELPPAAFRAVGILFMVWLMLVLMALLL